MVGLFDAFCILVVYTYCAIIGALFITLLWEKLKWEFSNGFFAAMLVMQIGVLWLTMEFIKSAYLN